MSGAQRNLYFTKFPQIGMLLQPTKEMSEDWEIFMCKDKLLKRDIWALVNLHLLNQNI